MKNALLRLWGLSQKRVARVILGGFLFALFLPLAFQNCSAGSSSENSMFSSDLASSSPSLIATVTNPQVPAGSPAVIIVTLASSPTSALSFQYQTVSQSAVAGTNFQQSSGTLDFSAGQISAQISIPTRASANAASSLSFTVEIGQLNASPPDYVSASVTLLANESPLYTEVNESTGMHFTSNSGSPSTGFAMASNAIIYIASSQTSSSQQPLIVCSQLYGSLGNYAYTSLLGNACPNGAYYIGQLGFIDTVHATGQVALYRWKNSSTGDHWDVASDILPPETPSPPASGYILDTLLGYGLPVN